MSIDVNTASWAEMKEFAKEQGFKVPGNISKAALVDLITRQTGQKEAVQVGGEANPEVSKLVARNLRDLRSQPKVEVFIHEDPRHPPRIPVSINGVRYTLKPGAWCKVPRAVADVLQNAVQGHISTHIDDQGRVQTTRRTALQFPFQMRPLEG